MIIKYIEYIVCFYFGFASFYVLFFSIAGFFFKEEKYKDAFLKKKVAVLIPAYEEDQVIIETAQSALQQKYPKKFFDIIVIADSLQKNTIDVLKKMAIKLIEVHFDKSTKTKAINKALENIDENYDITLILDADNIMEPNFIKKINNAFHKGHKVIQGHRIAKNNNTSIAVLDAISEEINNHIFRRGHNAIGIACGIMGSGMAFDFQYFKSMIKSVTAVGGFDKELEFNILENGDTIKYLNEAYLYDEKIQKANDFKRQRRRWLATKFIYFKKNIGKAIFQLKKGNFAYISKLYQMIMPTRILLLGSVGLISCIYFLFTILSSTKSTPEMGNIWYSILVITITSFIISIPIKHYNFKTLKALWGIPKVFFIMLILLFKLKGANETFIHTKHQSLNN